MTLILLERIAWLGIRDPVSALSHGAGAVLAVVGTYLLFRRAADSELSRRGIVRLVVFGLSIVAAFAASFLFHFFDRPPEEIVFFKKLDHAAIFLLIASTTAAIIGFVDRPWAARVIRVVWALAFIGIILKMTVWPMPLWMSALTYLSIGWIGVLSVIAFAGSSDLRRLRPVFHASIVMSLASLAFVLEQPVVLSGIVEGHEVFHLAVLAGIAMFYGYIYRRCGIMPCNTPTDAARDEAPVAPSVHPRIVGEVS